MMAGKLYQFDIDDELPVMSFRSFILLLLGAAGGAAIAIQIIPGWLPGLSMSLQDGSPHAFWYLSRASAGVAYLLIWLSMTLGLLITNKLARLWPGGPVAFDLHQYFSLLGLAFALFHALILMGDQYIHYSLTQVLTPFASTDYRPVWVGLGQIGFYLMGIVALSFYIRRRITPRVWRIVHYLSFVVFSLTLIHGLKSGTDSTNPWALSFYWTSGGLLLFFFIYRLLASLFKPGSPVAKRVS
jgi:predicted ferric reductase